MNSICCYHLYQNKWTAKVGKPNICEREPLNSSGRYAVASCFESRCCCWSFTKTIVMDFGIVYIEKCYH